MIRAHDLFTPTRISIISFVLHVRRNVFSFRTRITPQRFVYFLHLYYNIIIFVCWPRSLRRHYCPRAPRKNAAGVFPHTAAAVAMARTAFGRMTSVQRGRAPSQKSDRNLKSSRAHHRYTHTKKKKTHAHLHKHIDAHITANPYAYCLLK